MESLNLKIGDHSVEVLFKYPVKPEPVTGSDISQLMQRLAIGHSAVRGLGEGREHMDLEDYEWPGVANELNNKFPLVLIALGKFIGG
ncbi:MAG: hypothetical protein GY847_14420 [Proteobacteria bacterium]|nr:hypothetical protein [Pseudomonadota bacterium]